MSNTNFIDFIVEWIHEIKCLSIESKIKRQKFVFVEHLAMNSCSAKLCI